MVVLYVALSLKLFACSRTSLRAAFALLYRPTIETRPHNRQTLSPYPFPNRIILGMLASCYALEVNLADLILLNKSYIHWNTSGKRLQLLPKEKNIRKRQLVATERSCIFRKRHFVRLRLDRGLLRKFIARRVNAQLRI